MNYNEREREQIRYLIEMYGMESIKDDKSKEYDIESNYINIAKDIIYEADDQYIKEEKIVTKSILCKRLRDPSMDELDGKQKFRRTRIYC